MNLVKHGLAFDVAQNVWDDPLHIVIPHRFEDGEQRWHIIGMVGPVALVLVVHTYPDPDEDDRIRIIGARKATRQEGDSMSRRDLSPDQLDQLAKLAALPEDLIDTVDIPEAPVEHWIQARRGDLYRPLKQPVTIRLDADVITWFKEHAASGGYQTEINRVLRQHVVEAEKRRA
jgi:uncharacterized DUF497 family protein